MDVRIGPQALREPRILRLARRLGLNAFDVLGRLTHVWMLCYERRDEFVPLVDGDTAAGELEGFTAGMVAEGLADLADERTVRIRGVSHRINYSEKQSERGRIGGSVARKTSANLQNEANAKQVLRERLPRARDGARDRARDREDSSSWDLESQNQRKISEPERRSERSAPSSLIAPQLEIWGETPQGERGSETGTRVDSTNGATPIHSAGVAPGVDPGPEMAENSFGEGFGRLRKGTPEPPEQAITFAHLLFDHVVRNNPSGRLAKAPPRLRDQTIIRWAASIDKLHRLDDIEWGAIGGMIAWCQRDPFWRTVILGADNLREQWDKMCMRRNRNAGHPNAPRPGPTELAKRDVEDLELAEARKVEV